MTSTITASPGLAGDVVLTETDRDQLEEVSKLADRIGRIPGRPLIMRELGVTDARARKLIDFFERLDSRTITSDGRAGDVRRAAPAGEPSITAQPAGATPSIDLFATGHQIGGEQVGPDNHQEAEATVGGPEDEAMVPRSPAPATTPATSAVVADVAGSSNIMAAAPTTTTSPTTPTPPHTTTPATNTTSVDEYQRPAGATGFYITAIVSMLVSIDTSWRFFGDQLHITDWRERIAMFAVLEIALVACGYGMRSNVRRAGTPGAPRLAAWVLCGVAAYMAWQLSGVGEGLARIALGPALGLYMLHLALGIEIRAAAPNRTTAWIRIGRELRERVLSRLGLADDERGALVRTRDRAARRVARLTLGTMVPFRQARVSRALRTANIAHDPAARGRMLAELATLRHADQLANLVQPSPWGYSEEAK